MEEKKKTHVISVEDVKNIRNFFKHFHVPWPDEVEAACKAFEENQSFENEDKLRNLMAKNMSTIDHPAFKDKMFEGINKEAEDIAYHVQFDKDLEETLKEKEEKKD